MLKKYTGDDFKMLNSWITDEEILFRFSGPDWTFPLTEEDINIHILKYPFRQFYIGYDNDGKPYAFGQIIWNENNSPRLGRLLIGDPGKRGKGMGQKFVKELISECRNIIPNGDIHLFVYEDNISAIKCYEKVGFTFNGDTNLTLIHNDKTLHILKMTLNM